MGSEMCIRDSPQGGAAYWEGSDGPGGGSGGPGGGSGGPGGHWASSVIGKISNTPVSEAGSIFPGTPYTKNQFFGLGAFNAFLIQVKPMSKNAPR